MKKLFGQLQHEWIFIFGLLYCFQFYFWKQNFLFLVLTVLISIRIVFLKNHYTLKLTIIICLISLLINGIKFNNQMKYKHMDLDRIDNSFLIYIDPIGINWQEDYFNGPAKAQIKLEARTITLPVQISFYHRGDFIHEHTSHPAIWLIEGKFSRPDLARNFGTFDYRDYLENQAIYWQVELETVHQQQLDLSLKNSLFNLRNQILYFYQSKSDQAWIALHNKLIWNLNSNFYREIQDSLQALGIVHLFSLSGFHLVFIRNFLSYILLRLGVTVEDQRWISFLILGVYLFLTRFPVGLLRSFMMFYLRQFNKILKLPLSQMDIFALTGIIFILIHSQIVLSLAFQLSFLMTYVIQLYNQREKSENVFLNELTISLSCLLFSWPIIIQISHTWNPIQLLYVALMTMLFSKLMMPAISLTTLILILPTHLVQLFVGPLNYLAYWLGIFANHPRGPDIFSINIGMINLIELLILFALAVYFINYFPLNPKRTVLLVILVYASIVFIKPYSQYKDRINLIDVGQGDAILLSKSYNQGHWLVDTGGRAKFGDNGQFSLDLNYPDYNLIPALKALGVRKLDGLIISHMDIDHVGSLAKLAQEISIEKLYINNYSRSDPLWEDLLVYLGHIPVEIVPSGQVTAINPSLMLYSLADEHLSWSQSPSNDSSLVVQFQLGSVFYLGTGDLSLEFEEKLLDDFPNIKGEFLKLGHHGSNTSSSDKFLNHLQPLLALNSAGVNNRYGHPHQEVLTKLSDAKIPLLSSHIHGAIEISYSPWSGYVVKKAIQN